MRNLKNNLKVSCEFGTNEETFEVKNCIHVHVWNTIFIMISSILVFHLTKYLLSSLKLFAEERCNNGKLLKRNAGMAKPLISKLYQNMQFSSCILLLA